LIYKLSFSSVDIDECATDNGHCSSEAVCHNSVGSYTCSCPSGYAGNGFICTGKAA